ncbi:unnamed protein product [Mytilus edulis]|uniref:Uncharacterized protein n=1 Tax=Mytilus edulis TaxID=6550 RepID=A0A8S3Q463_MYTED|nr:unnamed protein product [Mytilus edulis]
MRMNRLGVLAEPMSEKVGLTGRTVNHYKKSNSYIPALKCRGNSSNAVNWIQKNSSTFWLTISMIKSSDMDFQNEGNLVQADMDLQEVSFQIRSRSNRIETRPSHVILQELQRDGIISERPGGVRFIIQIEKDMNVEPGRLPAIVITNDLQKKKPL